MLARDRRPPGQTTPDRAANDPPSFICFLSVLLSPSAGAFALALRPFSATTRIRAGGFVRSLDTVRTRHLDALRRRNLWRLYGRLRNDRGFLDLGSGRRWGRAHFMALRFAAIAARIDLRWQRVARLRGRSADHAIVGLALAPRRDAHVGLVRFLHR